VSEARGERGGRERGGFLKKKERERGGTDRGGDHPFLFPVFGKGEKKRGGEFWGRGGGRGG